MSSIKIIMIISLREIIKYEHKLKLILNHYVLLYTVVMETGWKAPRKTN